MRINKGQRSNMTKISKRNDNVINKVTSDFQHLDNWIIEHQFNRISYTSALKLVAAFECIHHASIADNFPCCD
jgi:hypothetical protein